jgi:hypothetical protein
MMFLRMIKAMMMMIFIVISRYINDCINPLGWNVKFVKYPERGVAAVVAIRDIGE